MKKLFLVLAASILATSAFAQNFERSKFLDNWYVGINGGAAIKTTGSSFSNDLIPTFGIRAGKNLTPVFGLAADAAFYTGVKPYNSIGTIIQASNISGLGTLNLMNAIGGYLGEPRAFEITALYGVGWLHTYGNGDYYGLADDSGTDHYSKVNRISSKLALNFAYNFGAAKQFGVYLEPSLTYLFLGDFENHYYSNYGHKAVSQGNQPGYNINNSYLALNLGFTYKFKNSNGTHNFKYSDRKYTQADVDALQSEIDALRGRKPEVVTKEVTKESDPITREINVSDLVFVTFAQGSSWIGSEAKEALNSIPEGRHVQVVGTASPEGDADLNQKLSEDRANKVADYLRERGVIVDSAQGLGVQSSTSNRLAIVYVK